MILVLSLVLRLVVPYVGTWIEIASAWLPSTTFSSRSLRGNVDRNRILNNLLNINWVVPYVGTWIEMTYDDEHIHQNESFPTWERG